MHADSRDRANFGGLRLRRLIATSTAGIAALAIFAAAAPAEVINPQVVKPEVVAPQVVSPPAATAPPPAASPAPAPAPDQASNSGEPTASAPPSAASQAPAAGPSAPQSRSGQRSAGDNPRPTGGNWFPRNLCAGNPRACAEVAAIELDHELRVRQVLGDLVDSVSGPIGDFLDQFRPDRSPAPDDPPDIDPDGSPGGSPDIVPDSPPDSSPAPDGGNAPSPDGTDAPSSAEEDCQCSLAEPSDGGGGSRSWLDDGGPLEEE
jgi:hypothetical protein